MTNELLACREAFEKWVTYEGMYPDHAKMENSIYLLDSVQSAWSGYAQAWNASPAANVDAWQGIESAPKDGSYVLLYDDQYRHSEASYLIAKYRGGMWFGKATLSGKSHVWKEATHWMPLPAPPIANAEESTP